MTYIVINILKHGSVANEIDTQVIKLLHNQKKKLTKLKVFAKEGLIFRHNEHIVIKNKENEHNLQLFNQLLDCEDMITKIDS